MGGGGEGADGLKRGLASCRGRDILGGYAFSCNTPNHTRYRAKRFFLERVMRRMKRVSLALSVCMLSDLRLSAALTGPQGCNKYR